MLKITLQEFVGGFSHTRIQSFIDFQFLENVTIFGFCFISKFEEKKIFSIFRKFLQFFLQFLEEKNIFNFQKNFTIFLELIIKFED